MFAESQNTSVIASCHGIKFTQCLKVIFGACKEQNKVDKKVA